MFTSVACSILIDSAATREVLNPIPISFVIFCPAIGTTAVCFILPSVKIAISVVPPPISTKQTPNVLSSSVKTE